jgi:eukaryotic-like serine/threonine-protein kinase
MNEETLFELALNTPEAERAALLDRECAGNPELRRRIEALLVADAAPKFLAEPADDPVHTQAFVSDPRPTSDFQDKNEQAGTILAGKYRLSERIGEGGMGSVWLAHQSEPVKRKVAVKLIKAGMDSKAVLARFDAERQALAVMDHPNIAKVLDGGLHDGRPFFVMELVKGVPITEYCDACKLTPKERLELFVPVCQAIQHAHQKGIIHRDIKPSNVLIALYDDKPVPKVIDFGIAKATGGTLTEHTIETAFGGVVGTPQYMSPEQASLNNLDIDTRSDVYSLGVLLYELLTGSPPFARKELQKAGLLEILRVVREEEPPRPSTKLSTADALPSLSASRGTEPKKLTGLLRNELDWIVMKSLEKDRSRRYETANGFAADVNRYLSGEAVLAHPPSTAYRVKKFVRRHKGQVIAASLVLCALIAGIVGTTLGLLEARRQTELARIQEAVAKQQEGLARQEAMAKELARAEEAVQRKRAEEFRNKALDALRATTGTDVEQLLGGKTELGANEKAYLEAIAKRWQAFSRLEGTDEQTQAIRAEGHFRVATLRTKLGQREEARLAFEQAQLLRKKLAADFTTVPEYRRDLAQSHHNLASLLDDLGMRAEAEEHYNKALLIQGKLVADFPDVPEYRNDQAFSRGNLGILLDDLGRVADAEVQLKQAIAIQRKLAVDFPAVPKYRRDLAASHNNLGNVLVDLRKRAEAEEQFREAVEIQEKLAAEFPARPEYPRALAQSRNNLGTLLKGLEKWVEAEDQYQQTLRIQKKLVADFPSVPDYRSGLARCHNNLGILLKDMGKRPEAEDHYKSALTIQEKLAVDFPRVTECHRDLGGSYCNFGILVRDGGRASESLDWFAKAIATLAPLVRVEPRDVETKRFLLNSHYHRAKAYDQLQKPADAVKDWDKTIELSPPERQAEFRADRAKSRSKAGLIAEAVAEVAELTKSPNWKAGQWYGFAGIYAVASGKIADKKAEYTDRAMELLQKAVKEGYKDAAHIKQDTDLDPLRDRAEFKQLLAELEAKYPMAKELAPLPREKK